MMIISEEYITGLLTNYYEYADNIRNLPVKELMRGHVRGSCFFVHFISAGETSESLAGNQ